MGPLPDMPAAPFTSFLSESSSTPLHISLYNQVHPMACEIWKAVWNHEPQRRVVQISCNGVKKLKMTSDAGEAFFVEEAEDLDEAYARLPSFTFPISNS